MRARAALAALVSATALIGTGLSSPAGKGQAATEITCQAHAVGGPVTQARNLVVASTNAVDVGVGDAECASLTGLAFKMTAGVKIQFQDSSGVWTDYPNGQCQEPWTEQDSTGNAAVGTVGVITEKDMRIVCNLGPLPLGGVLHRAAAGVWNSVDQSFTWAFSAPWTMN